MNRQSASTRFLILFSLIFSGFLAGFIASTHVKHSLSTEQSDSLMARKGEAPADVRMGVQAAVDRLLAGYTRRDPSTIPAFVNENFPAHGDVLVMGAEGNVEEWAHSRKELEQFVYNDWSYWGHLHLDSSKAIVNSTGDVAWMATLGTVEFGRFQKPVRFTAVLERENGRYVYRQIQFQWNESNAETNDLLDLDTYAQMIRKFIVRFKRE